MEYGMVVNIDKKERKRERERENKRREFTYS
jgi:hypothetical protein